MVAPSGRAAADDLVWRVGAESTGYQDTDATSVITPGVHAEVGGVTTGWAVGAGLLVDVVTSASSDIVATASPKWTDVRYVPSASVRFKVDNVTTALSGGGSIESDYYAASAGASMSLELNDKLIVPSFGYSFGYGLGGRRGTPLDVYSLEVMSHSLASAITFIVNKSTLVVPGVNVIIEHGAQEKPYRTLPTFAVGISPEKGASASDVDAARTPIRMLENTPKFRHRYAGSFLVAHRFGDATVRVEERLYADSWWLMATTTDFTLPVDVASDFRLWPHARLHAQKGVSFWERTYFVEPTETGARVPTLRTGDRELGPMVALTAGAGFRIGGKEVGFSLNADAIYTRFLDHLYIQDRLGGFGGVAFDLEVQ